MNAFHSGAFDDLQASYVSEKDSGKRRAWVTKQKLDNETVYIYIQRKGTPGCSSFTI